MRIIFYSDQIIPDQYHGFCRWETKRTPVSRVGPYGKENNSKSKTLIWKSCCKHITWGIYKKVTIIKIMIDKYKKLIDMCKNITCGRVENIRQSVETITKRQETTATAYNASCLSNIFSSCVVLVKKQDLLLQRCW